MNNFTALHTEYLRPSRTIETVLVTKDNLSQVFFIYNYEGNSFRIFKNHLDLILFFKDKAEEDFEFGTEEELDWLVWNDRNGVCRDEDSLREFNNILGKGEAIFIITRQIFH